MKKGEVWFVEFPLEEDPDRILNRPVFVLDEILLGVLSFSYFNSPSTITGK